MEEVDEVLSSSSTVLTEEVGTEGSSGEDYSEDAFEGNSYDEDSFEEEEEQVEKKETLDEVLCKLASDRELPAQIADLRTLSGDAVVDKALDQLAIDLVAAQRVERRNAAARNAQRRAQRARADERRRLHEKRLAESIAEARESSRKAETLENEAKDLKSRLENTERLLESSKAAHATAARRCASLEWEVKALRRTSAGVAADAGVAARSYSKRIADLEEKARRKELEIEVTVEAQRLLERRYDAMLDRLPDVERRRVAVEDERLRTEREAIQIEKLRQDRDKQSFEDFVKRERQILEDSKKESEKHRERELQARRRELDAEIVRERESIRQAKEEIAATLAANEARALVVARDQARLESASARLGEERVSLLVRAKALEPRFKDAQDAEERAAKRIAEAAVVEEKAQELLESAKRDHREVLSRAAELEEQQAAAREARRRANDAAARLEFERTANQQTELDRARFYAKARRDARSRHLAATEKKNRPSSKKQIEELEDHSTESFRHAALNGSEWPTIPRPPPSEDDDVPLPTPEPTAIARKEVWGEAPGQQRSRLRAEIDALPEPGIFGAAARQLSGYVGGG